LLSILLLYKNNFDISKYISFEEQINKNKSDYYEKLKVSSIGWNENRNTYIPFIENFITALNNCYKQLNDKYLKIKDIKSKKEQIEEIIYNSLAPISKKEIADILLDVSITTIELTLSKLLKSGKIIKIGTTNSAKYIKK
jgi:Fic family protein